MDANVILALLKQEYMTIHVGGKDHDTVIVKVYGQSIKREVFRTILKVFGVGIEDVNIEFVPNEDEMFFDIPVNKIPWVIADFKLEEAV
jgi:ribosomal protein L23